MCENFGDGRPCKLKPTETALNNVYRSIMITPDDQCFTADQLLLSTNGGIRKVLTHCLSHGENIKVYATTKVLMRKINFSTGEVEKEDTVYFSNRAVPIQSRFEIDDFIDNVKQKLEADLEKYTSKGSNWIVGNIENISLRLVKYRLLRGGAANFQLPPKLAAKTCLLNINTADNECFKYAVVAGLPHGEIDQHNKNRRFQYDQYIGQ